MPAFISDDGISLHFDILGHGALPVICLHLMGGDSSTWTALLEGLDPSLLQGAALDFRGHGKSERAPSTFTIERLACDVIHLADTLQWERFVVAGHSFGGKVALRVAALVPQRVSGLVLIGATGPGLVPLDRPSMEGIVQRAADLGFIREVFRPWFHVWPRPDIDQAIISFARTPIWALQAVCEAALWTDISEDVKHVTAPTLAIAGDRDPVYAPSYQAQAVHPFVPNATVVTIADCGHGLILERPAEIAGHLGRFLRSFR